ncbi:MAG TPA: tetratricopeptide repeat protein [Bacteroidota bacterium]|nr:tetratricopeptide repeat protein [Bacteroidota bacterium]
MKIFAVNLILLGSLSPLLAQTPVDAFARGNQFYREGRFAEAIAEYESIVGQGFTSAELCYNLGNAYYRTGKIGRAILFYERALRLSPGDPDIEHNLALANMRTVDRIEPLPELFFMGWIRGLTTVVSVATSRTFLIASWILLFASLTVFFFLSNDRWLRVLRTVATVAVVLTGMFGVLFVVQIAEAQSRNEAIVLSSTVTVKSSPDAQSVDAFVIHEGLKVKVGDRVGEWVRITLADGKVGWVQVADIERI